MRHLLESAAYGNGMRPERDTRGREQSGTADPSKPLKLKVRL